MITLHSSALSELLGWAAALLTLCTFICSDMRRLRMIALAANASFIAYGLHAQLMPVLALHLALVPVNLWRLADALRREAAGRVPPGAPGVAVQRGAGNTADSTASPAAESGQVTRKGRCASSTRRHAASRRALPAGIPGYRAPRAPHSLHWLQEAQQ